MNLFDWLKEINNKKSPVGSFSQEDWDQWNSYMVHRFLSMNPNLLELVNEVQSLPPTDKQQIYSIYREYVPKNNKWSKYIKSNIKSQNKDLVTYFVDYFQLSSREVKDYLSLLSNKEITNLLSQLGIEDKEIKKLLK
jgi:hypothetical protein